VQAITSEPGEVFSPGSVLVASRKPSAEGREFGRESGDAGRELPTWTVERSRAFKDGWLVKFAGIEDKTEADKCRGIELSADEATLAPPDENEVYLDELTGMTVRDEPHGELGVVAGYYELPQGLVLEVRGEKWKADIPFNDAFIQMVDRQARSIAVTLPDGLLEPTAVSRPESRD
jgi:16S rRNA processing protein RimM